MEKYKSNSHKSRERAKAELPEKKVEKIVSGSVINKLAGIFVPEDVDNVKSYIFEDIIVPAVKDIILDAVKAVLGVKGSGGRKSMASKVSYRKYYEDPAQNDRRNYNAQSSIGGCDFDDIYFNTRTDNIRNARVVNTRDGYTIKFPRANPID